LNRKKAAAKMLHKLGSSYVVVKGGHGEGEELVDLLFDGYSYHELKSTRIDTRHTHGTGCTFAAAIAAQLAKGSTVEKAVFTAKQFIHAAIKQELGIGSGHGPTNHWAYRKSGVEV
jgi:hydroxymethylpyrimidine/phosphomethylpyrimidine kinase